MIAGHRCSGHGWRGRDRRTAHEPDHRGLWPPAPPRRGRRRAGLGRSDRCTGVRRGSTTATGIVAAALSSGPERAHTGRARHRRTAGRLRLRSVRPGSRSAIRRAMGRRSRISTERRPTPSWRAAPAGRSIPRDPDLLDCARRGQGGDGLHRGLPHEQSRRALDRLPAAHLNGMPAAGARAACRPSAVPCMPIRAERSAPTLIGPDPRSARPSVGAHEAI